MDRSPPARSLCAGAGEVHCFEEFSEDLAVWLVFHGPVKYPWRSGWRRSHAGRGLRPAGRRAGARVMLRLTLTYFGLVFGAGFVLGTIRTVWVVPAVGERAAELIEAPFMLIAIVLAARFVVRRHDAPRARLLAAGALAAALVLGADILVGLGLRHMTLAEVLRGRDGVTRGVYYALVAAFAALPCLSSRRR